MTLEPDQTPASHARVEGGVSCADKLAAALNSEHRYIDDIPGIERLFDAFVASREYETAYLKAIREMVESEPSKTDRTIGTAFTIFRNSNFLVVIQMLDTGPADGMDKQPAPLLATNPDNGLQSVITVGGELTICRYSLPQGTDLSVFDPDARLEFVSETALHSMSPCYRYYAGEVTRTVFNGAVCVIRLREATLLDYQWTFDGTSLVPVFPSVTLPSVGRFETVIDLMVKFSGDRIEESNAISFLKKMLEHRLHFIRWKAVQGLGEIDGDEAMIALKAMRDDPHPHVRAAAREAYEELTESAEN